MMLAARSRAPYDMIVKSCCSAITAGSARGA
jgi:hypothetical protein